MVLIVFLFVIGIVILKACIGKVLKLVMNEKTVNGRIQKIDSVGGRWNHAAT